MFGFLRRAGERAAERDMEKHLRFFRVAGPEQAAFLRVAAAQSIAALAPVMDKHDLDFVFDVLGKGTQLTPDQSVKVSNFNSRLIKIRAKAYEDDNPHSTLMGSGITAWILTFRALTYPSLAPLAMELWQHIERGQDNYEETLLDLVEGGVVEPGAAVRTFAPPTCFATA